MTITTTTDDDLDQWAAIYESDEKTRLEHVIMDLLIEFPAFKGKVAQLLRDEAKNVEAGDYDEDVEETKETRR
jgi:hypothetical protein